MAEQEFDAGQDLAFVEPTALAEITKGEINMQVATAKRWPRVLSKFKEKALSLATLDRETATSCYYKLRRAGKAIEGPSIRLAEICTTAWGNLRAGARVISIDEKHVTSQGVFHDLEHNVQVSMEVKRRITDKEGRRFSDDMIVVTSNAANAIAFRNACFKGIPYSYIHDIYIKVKAVARGDVKELGTRRTEALAKFAEIGVNEKRVLTFLRRPKTTDIDLSDLEDLFGIYTAIQDRETTVEEQFPTGKPQVTSTTPRAASKKVAAAAAKVDNANGKKPEPPMPEAEYKKACNELLPALNAQGLTSDELSGILVKAGYLADTTAAEPKERRGLVALLQGWIEKPKEEVRSA